MELNGAGLIGQSEMILLRKANAEDVPYILAVENSEENTPFITQWSREQHLEALADPDQMHLIVEAKPNSRPIGYVIMAGLQNPHQSLELRRLAIQDKGKGYGRKTLRLVKSWAFGQLGTHRLWLDVRDHNTRARHLYASEGFKVEGILRECVKVGDGYESLVIMSMLASEVSEVSGS